ncbi:MAG: GntR family transcriptional regulator [Anaerovoracaceae bacterium]
MFQLDLKSRKSIYEQIVDRLKELVISQILKPEDKLPSVRELSRKLTVNPNTVQKAYRELERQGYVYTASGLGTFVCEMQGHEINQNQLAELVSRLEGEINELYYLGVSKNDVKEIISKLILKKGDWK